METFYRALRLCLFAVLLPLSIGGCQRHSSDARTKVQPLAQPVEVTPVTRRDMADTLSVVGSLAANESVEVRPEVAGLIQAIVFEEGQKVAKGDLLVKIDDAELRAQIQQADARFRLTELTLNRSENLGETRTISQSELDRARADFAAAKAERTVLSVRLEKTEIRAPFDGIVGSRTISPGDYVTATTTLTTLNDLSRLKVEFDVPERYLRKLQPGTPFLLRARTIGVGAEVHGEVYFVSSLIDRATRSTEVKGILTNPPATLKPGMFANVELELEVRMGVLTVPEGAILSSTAGPQVIAVMSGKDENIAEFIPVRLGLRSKGFVEITPLRGVLADTQSVVASGVGSLILFPGARLEPRPLKPEFQIKG